jgi:chemotaxis protein methyltransferase CheR
VSVVRVQVDAKGIDAATAIVPLLRDLVHETTGQFFDDSRLGQLMDKLKPLVLARGFRSALDYYYLLKYDADAAEEWGHVLDALAVPETYFWREIDQIQALVDVVVTALVKALAGQPLRIWSIPCATGEEPLTLAMALNEAGWFERAPIEIHGSDASGAGIARARRGLYRERAFRNLPPDLKDRYFTRRGDEWEVAPELHRRVTWSTVNVMDRAAAGARARVPIVFCRNLFIYFSEKSIGRTVQLFAEHMSSPGYLCVGASESLLRIPSDFEIDEIGGAFMYVLRSRS